MDKKVQDIHYKTRYEEYVSRCVEVKQIRFYETDIEIDYEITGKMLTMVLPKLCGFQLIID